MRLYLDEIFSFAKPSSKLIGSCERDVPIPIQGNHTTITPWLPTSEHGLTFLRLQGKKVRNFLYFKGLPGLYNCKHMMF